MTRLEQYRPAGTRNWIRLGDIVHVKPSRPGKRDGFDARVRRIEADEAGAIVAVEVAAVRSDRAAQAVRTFPPARIERRAQTRQESNHR